MYGPQLIGAATTPLVLMNVALGLACLGCVVAVAIAAWMDVRERRRWRALVPPCWPPPGIDPADAYVDDASLSTATNPERREAPFHHGSDA